MTIDEIPENTIQPPTWMDQAYLTNVLREGLKAPQLELIKYRIKPATAVGDNYASQMFRATLLIQKTPSGSSEPQSVVIKTIPRGAHTDEMLGKMNIFEKEAQMLTKVLPRMNELLAKVYPDHQPLNADCIWYGSDPEDVIVIQDLKEFGFSNADRMSGLDINLTNIVLKSLARYHASSLALIKEDPTLVEPFTAGVWVPEFDEMLRPMVLSSMEGLIQEVSTWEEIPKESLERLRTLEQSAMSKVYDSTEINKDSLNVLVHGDCWINNFMFSNMDGNDLGFRFVDFQIGHLNSAVIDLNYFLFTSPSASIRVSKLDEMLETYYNSFTEALQLLKIELSQPFTLEDLRKEFKRRSFYGLFALIIVYPITTCPPKSAPKFDDFFEKDNSKRYLYQTEKFRKVFNLCLPYFIENGAL